MPLTAPEPVAELLFTPSDNTPISTDPSTLRDWRQALDALAAAPKVWLATVRKDRRPHAAPVLAVWRDNALHLSTRPGTVKGRNLERERRCAITVATDTLDLVLEGSVRRAVRDCRA